MGHIWWQLERFKMWFEVCIWSFLVEDKLNLAQCLCELPATYCCCLSPSSLRTCHRSCFCRCCHPLLVAHNLITATCQGVGLDLSLPLPLSLFFSPSLFFPWLCRRGISVATMKCNMFRIAIKSMESESKPKSKLKPRLATCHMPQVLSLP